MSTHKMKDGAKIKISDMTDNHLLNTIQLLRRKAKKGVVIQFGGGSCAEDIWYDEDIIFDEEALKILNIKKYLNEVKRRGLTCDT